MNESHQDAADALTRTMKTLHDYTKQVGDQAYEAFTAHPRAKRMTYCEHFRGAAWTALRMMGGAAALAVHSVFPFLLQTTGSDTVSALHLENQGGLKEDDVEEPEGLDVPEGHQEESSEESSQEESSEEPEGLDMPEGHQEESSQEQEESSEEPSEESTEESSQEQEESAQESAESSEEPEEHQEEPSEEPAEESSEEPEGHQQEQQALEEPSEDGLSHPSHN